MALCTTGSMSLGGSTSGRSVNCELGQSGTTCISMGETNVRDLAGISSGTISLSDFYGATLFEPTTLGQSCGGGFYMGTIAAAGTTYYLVVAPNATGCSCCQWKTSDSSTSGTSSRVDGYDNTYNSLTNSTHPAGNWTATRTIGGFSDWYLPAIEELILFYNNGGAAGTGDPLPAGEDFAEELYHSSTECNVGCACRLCFKNEQAGRGNKIGTVSVRAVRRVPI